MQAFSRESTLGRFGLSRSCELTHRFFWQNGMEMRLSLITASRSTRAPTISPSTTPRTLTMCRIIDSPRANGSGSSIPFGLALSRKRPAPPDRYAIPEKPHRSGPKRNPSPASDRIIEIATLPLTCTLARWRFRFAGLLSRVNASRSGGYAARSGGGALRALFSALRAEIWENLYRKSEKIWLDSHQLNLKP